MEKIITLTLNPAFDTHCVSDGFAIYHENLARVTSSEAGGKGVNISRALAAGGTENLCFAVLGSENGDEFARALGDGGLRFRTLTLPGRIRENITIHTAGKPETRISFEGFSADEGLLGAVFDAIGGEVGAGTVLTFTGRVPAGIPMAKVKEFLARLVALGARIVVDSRSFTLDDILEVRPWLIKPNEEEIAVYLGREVSGFDEIRGAALDLARRGIENVMVSLGAKGAMLAVRGEVFIVPAPAISPLSTIGAGDSSIAGFLAAAVRGASPFDCLRTAVAYGSAACLTEGTKPPRREDIEKFLC